MTVWDSMALNAPHTEREIGDESNIKKPDIAAADPFQSSCTEPDLRPFNTAFYEAMVRGALRELAQDGEPAPGSTTDPENATCPSAGGFGASAGQAILDALAAGKEVMPYDDNRSNARPATSPGVTAGAGGFGGLAAVKPLEWKRREDIIGLHSAEGKTGWFYNVWVGEDGNFIYQGDPVSWPHEEPARHFVTLDEAKAAAQADYEARIQSALQSIVTPQAILTAIAAEKAEWPHAGSMHDGARMACDALAARVKKLMGVA